MDAVIVMSLVLLLALQSSAQYRAGATSNQAGPPYNCGKFCFPPDTFAKVFGATLCMCRSELCSNKQCGFQERCQVKSNLVGDTAECEAVPVTRPISPQGNSGKAATSDCSQPPRTGWCRALITRYYFDSTTRDCSSFVFGGCNANGNNFNTMQECRSSCMSRNAGGGGGGGGGAGGRGSLGGFNPNTNYNYDDNSNYHYNGNNYNNNNGYPRLNNGRAVSNNYPYRVYRNRYAGK